MRRTPGIQMCGRSGRPTALVAVFVLASTVVGPTGAVAAAGDDDSPSAKSKAAQKTSTARSKADLAAAKDAYEEALRAFNLGQWDEAVVGFQRSYRLSGDAALLFNIAQAQRQAGNVKEAIRAYKAFLREKPDTPQREMIEAKLKELETASAAKAATAAAQPVTGPPSPPPAPLVPTAPAVPAHAPGLASPAVDEPTQPPAAPGPVSSIVAPIAPPASWPASDGQAAAPASSLDLRQQPQNKDEVVASDSGPRWWLWTGIGAAVVAGVVTAVILSTRGTQRDGTCPSGLDGCIPVGK